MLRSFFSGSCYDFPTPWMLTMPQQPHALSTAGKLVAPKTQRRYSAAYLDRLLADACERERYQRGHVREERELVLPELPSGELLLEQSGCAIESAGACGDQRRLASRGEQLARAGFVDDAAHRIRDEVPSIGIRCRLPRVSDARGRHEIRGYQVAPGRRAELGAAMREQQSASDR